MHKNGYSQLEFGFFALLLCLAVGTEAAAREIARVEIAATVNAPADNVPVTFGHLFSAGDVPRTSTLQAQLPSGDVIPLQFDRKVTHPDGSIRHGLVTVVIPHIEPQKNLNIALHSLASAKPAGDVVFGQLLPKTIPVEVRLKLSDGEYRADINELLKNKPTQKSLWLSGLLVEEILLSARFKDGQGTPHPHLTLKCALRAFRNFDGIRMDFAIENTAAFAQAPRNYRYDVSIKIGEKIAFEKKGLNHVRQARWRKILWLGQEPGAQALVDTRYLMQSGALPNYDPNQPIAKEALRELRKKLASAQFDPLSNGIAAKAMGTTGGRGEIGPLPSWAAMFLISRDAGALAITLAMGDLGGSWPIHYRDEKTDRPVTIEDFPYMTIFGTDLDAINPRTNKSEKFPNCGGDCTSEFQPDSAHQPSFAYLPYVLTGDFYYLEELQFWANWNMLQHNPAYREFEKGLFKPDQIRGQAWSLRTLAHAAYITPDDDLQKNYLLKRVRDNLNWYVDKFVHSADSNKLGVLTGAYAFSYEDGRAIAPWQDDFFTWSAGYAYALGFSEAKPLVEWKAKFPVARVLAPGYCWIFAAPYALTLRKDGDSKRLYDSWEEIYRVNYGEKTNESGIRLGNLACASKDMADWLTRKSREKNPGAAALLMGEMTGYAASAEGFPAILQPALAVAVDAAVPEAEMAWQKYLQRSVKQDYGQEPQFDVVPRKVTKK